MKAALTVYLLGALLALATTSFADGVSWEALNDDTRAVLEPLRDDWDDVPPQQRERLVSHALRWSNLTPEQQERARGRLKRWQSMSPEQKQAMRERLKDWNGLSEDEKDQLRRQRAWFRALPEQKRQALRSRWQSMTPDQRGNLRERIHQFRRAEPAERERMLREFRRRWESD